MVAASFSAASRSRNWDSASARASRGALASWPVAMAVAMAVVRISTCFRSSMRFSERLCAWAAVLVAAARSVAMSFVFVVVVMVGIGWRSVVNGNGELGRLHATAKQDGPFGFERAGRREVALGFRGGDAHLQVRNRLRVVRGLGAHVHRQRLQPVGFARAVGRVLCFQDARGFQVV